MKKTTLKLCLVATIAIFSMSSAKAQPFVSPGTTPDAQLSSGFTNILFNTQTSIYSSISGNSPSTGLYINANTNGNNGASILLNGNNHGSTADGNMTFLSNAGAGTGGGFAFFRVNGSTWEPRILINEPGDMFISNKVAIGGTMMDERLNVDGNIKFTSSTSGYRSILANSVNTGLFLNASTNGASILLNGSAAGTTSDGDITFLSNSGSSTTGGGFLFSRQAGSTYEPRMEITESGNVHFQDIQLQPNNGNVKSLRFNSQNGNGYTEIYSGYDDNNGAAIIMGTAVVTSGNPNPNYGAYGNKGGMSFWAYRKSSSNTDQDEVAFDFVTNDDKGLGNQTDQQFPLTIRKNGKVVIGELLNLETLSGDDNKLPTGYRLYVQSGIITEKIKVAIRSDITTTTPAHTGGWSDFVFDEKYALPSLNYVEKFVKENKHLPEIPSAKEVYQDGIDLGEMDAKLLQKIEELTLYVIQQQKEINELKTRLNK